MKPLESIVIPNYKYGHFIKQTMESAVGSRSNIRRYNFYRIVLSTDDYLNKRF